MAINLDQIKLPNGATVKIDSQFIVLSTLNQFGGNPDPGTHRVVNEIIVAEQGDTTQAGQVVISFKSSQGSFSQIRLTELAPRVENEEILIGKK